MYNKKYLILFTALLAISSIAAAAGTVTVSVQNSNGDSVSRADVILYQNNYNRVGDAWTGSEGSATFNVESSASESIEYRATATKRCYSTDAGDATIDYNGDSETVDLQINKYESQGELTVNVLNDGSSVEGAAVTIDGPEEEEMATDSSGTVEFTGLQYGNYNVNVRVDSNTGERFTKTKTFNVNTCGPEEGDWTDGEKTFNFDFEEEPETDNQPPTVSLESPQDESDVTLPKEFEWSASDDDGDDSDLENTISIQKEGEGNPVIEENVGDDEQYTVEDTVEEGSSYIWWVDSDDGEDEQRSDIWSFTVQEGTGTLNINVEDGDDDNLEEARVTLSEQESRGPEYTDEDGDVSFSELTPGDYDIRVECNDQVERKYNQNLNSGQTRTTDIEFDQNFESDVCGESEEDEETDGLNAEFSFSPSSPEVGEEVDFDASASSGDIEEYRWDFDDGDEATGETVSHSFDSRGNYEVELTLENENEETDSTTETVNVERPRGQCRLDVGSLNLDPYAITAGDSSTASITVENEGDENQDIEVRIYKSDDTLFEDSQTIEDGDSTTFETDVSVEEDTLVFAQIQTEGSPCYSETFTRSKDLLYLGEPLGRATLNIQVDDQNDNDLEDARVTVENENRRYDFTNPDGEVSFQLRPGSYDAVVSKPGYRTERQSVTLADGEETDLDFTLQSRTRNEEDEDDTDGEIETAELEVNVEDGGNDELENARVTLSEQDYRGPKYTNRYGDVDFNNLEPGQYDIRVECNDQVERKYNQNLNSGQTRTTDIEFDQNFESDVCGESEEDEDDTDGEIETAELEVNVEDGGNDELENARVTLSEQDYRGPKYTNRYGDVDFNNLEPGQYDIRVECNDQVERKYNQNLNSGQTRTTDIEFDQNFESDVCGESEEDEDTDFVPDDDEEGLAIVDVSYPDSVCRGGSFRADLQIENRGGFHELVTITGSGLGSINTGESFSLDIAETKSASIRFTNVEGSGTEEFDIRATNHDSDETTQTINVRDCGAFSEQPSGRTGFDAAPSGVTAEVSPKETVVGKAVKVKGYVDGVRGRSQVTIRANGERKGTVSTKPDGFYSTYIRLNEIGDNIVRVSSGQSETSSVVEVVPTSTVSGISAPEKVFNSESFEICSQIDSQIEPKVFLMKNNEVVDSKLGNGEVCFETKASNPGEHDYQIKTLTYGKESSGPSKTVDVLELGNEVTNFPDQVATTESEEGMVKVELYNTNNETRRYKVKLNGIRTTWLSQSQEDVILTKGERETVYFYITPEDRGNFEPTVTVVSEDTTIYSEEISVYAGGTKKPRNASLLNKLSQIFRL